MIQPPQGLPVEETAVDQYPDDAAVTGRQVGFGLADQAPGVAVLMALDFRDDTGDWELGTEVKGHDGFEPENRHLDRLEPPGPVLLCSDPGDATRTLTPLRCGHIRGVEHQRDRAGKDPKAGQTVDGPVEKGGRFTDQQVGQESGQHLRAEGLGGGPCRAAAFHGNGDTARFPASGH